MYAPGILFFCFWGLTKPSSTYNVTWFVALITQAVSWILGFSCISALVTLREDLLIIYFSSKQSRKTNLDFDKSEKKKKTLCGSFFFFAPSAPPLPTGSPLRPARRPTHDWIDAYPRIAYFWSDNMDDRSPPSSCLGNVGLTHFLMKHLVRTSLWAISHL